MSSTDLEFWQGAATDGELVFGETSSGVFPPVDAYLTGTLPGLTVAVQVGDFIRANFVATLPAPTFTGQCAYDNRLTRYMQGARTAAYQAAIKERPTLEGSWGTSLNRRVSTGAPWEMGVRKGPDRDGSHSTAKTTRNTRIAPHQLADKLTTSRASRMQTGIVVRNIIAGQYQTADHLNGKTIGQLMQVASLVREVLGVRWQTATSFHRLTSALVGASTFRIGKPATVGRWQVALHLQAGAHPPDVIPPGHVCYTPSGDLVFTTQQTYSSSLLFRCDDDTDTPPPGSVIVVPVREVYAVSNNVQLRRVSDNARIACDSASLSLDTDSWSWNFSASMPGSMLSLVQADEPVEVKLLVNGTEVRLLLESVSRDRVFGSSSLKVSGRGINAELDAPYAGVQTFGGYAEMGAQQLMDEVLQFNEIPLGWTVNWGIDDWLIPADVFNHQGTYISALNAICGAAGAYLQPGLATKTLSVKHRYPLAPWDWGSVAADIELPSDVVVQEGLQWVKKPDYTRVYVSGEGGGILGRVTRAGTAGDVLAPMVTDQLIVATAAARQRGRAILSDTGKQVRATLGLPVLEETGIILPGTFIEYQDGATTRRGITRSINLSLGFPNVWQSIEVETHV